MSPSFPVPPSYPPVQFRTPSPQSQPTKAYLSSPVKPVAQHFAEHKHDEVQAFGYDEAIHVLTDFQTQEEFFNFLGVSEESSAKAIGKHIANCSGQGVGKVSGKSSGKVGAKSREASEEASNFSRKNF